ncbi:MAG: VOC family protein [Pseudomonadota bacterium]
MTPNGYFHWNELYTRDAETAKSFYAGCMGWTYDEMRQDDGGTYWICKAGDAPVAGIFTMTEAHFDGVPEHWMPYVASDDVDAAIAKARSAGATIIREPFDVPGVGRICILQEPGGATLGWMTPAS